MIPLTYAIPAFIIGLLILYKGSDILVEGTSKTAARIGISTLVISLIIVAFGTSSPEFAISVGAAFQSHQDISTGNIIGSCVANLLLVLGLSAIIQPVKIQRVIIKREMPLLVLTTTILFIFTLLNLLDRYHEIGGILFFIFFIIFLYYFYSIARKERRTLQRIEIGNPTVNLTLILVGLIGVIVGAWLLIEGAVAIATEFGIPEIIIALSLVAIGTSLPELVVSTMAALKKESDIAVGNIIGSNIFNILFILGLAAIIIPLNAIQSLDHIIFLVIITIIMVPILYTGSVITRKEGSFLLVLYAVYMWFLFGFSA